MCPEQCHSFCVCVYGIDSIWQQKNAEWFEKSGDWKWSDINFITRKCIKQDRKKEKAIKENYIRLSVTMGISVFHSASHECEIMLSIFEKCN